MTQKYLLWLILFITTPLSATPILTEKETPYQISGSTDQELRNEMNHSAPYYEGKHFDAHTTWYVQWKYDYHSENNVCRLMNMRVTVDINYHLPVWINRDEANPLLQGKWDDYIKHLKIHEQGHAENGKKAATEIEAMLYELPPMEKCQQLNAIANSKAKRIISKYNEKDVQYDEETHHGITQGAVFLVDPSL